MEENIVILSTIDILKTAEINIYLIKFNAKSKKLESAVILPDEINESILKDYEKYLYGFKNAKNIINLISKELKYNIFEDKVEI